MKIQYEPRKGRKSNLLDNSKRKKRKISPEWKGVLLPDGMILVNFYFDILANGCPILSREKFSHFTMNGLELCLQVEETELLEFNELIKSEEEMKGLLVWYSALLSLYYQFNADSELAELAAGLCEKQIHKYSFQCFDNMYYAAGC